MNKLLVTFLVALLVILLPASAAFASPAAEGVQIPFKGSVEATESYNVVIPTLYVSASGSGHATQLGQFTQTYAATVDIPTLTSNSPNLLTFTAANGDTLVAAGFGQATVISPTVYNIVETYNITGGTGRFTGATGSFTIYRVLNPVTGVSSGTFSGEIEILTGN